MMFPINCIPGCGPFMDHKSMSAVVYLAAITYINKASLFTTPVACTFVHVS